nr:MAG TPA: hypothetical protein [Caudoviricetes sp.]DAU40308.1 MAG TPA: hypothetical protein [Caudoviricetes sp.]
MIDARITKYVLSMSLSFGEGILIAHLRNVENK